MARSLHEGVRRRFQSPRNHQQHDDAAIVASSYHATKSVAKLYQQFSSVLKQPTNQRMAHEYTTKERRKQRSRKKKSNQRALRAEQNQWQNTVQTLSYPSATRSDSLPGLQHCSRWNPAWLWRRVRCVSPAHKPHPFLTRTNGMCPSNTSGCRARP